MRREGTSRVVDIERHEHGLTTEAVLPPRPGSDGERLVQRQLGTAERAERFYDEQVLDHLNPRMRAFVQQQEMFFLAKIGRAHV